MQPFQVSGLHMGGCKKLAVFSSWKEELEKQTTTYSTFFFCSEENSSLKLSYHGAEQVFYQLQVLKSRLDRR